jgi:hypothetical protein
MMLGSEHEMIVQAQVRGRHGRMVPAPLPGRTPFVAGSGGVTPG